MLFLRAWLAAVLFTTAGAQVCYGTSGNQDPSLQVCDTSSSPSACCQAGDICLSNGLCQKLNAPNAYTTYTIRGCTDPDGKTGECLPFGKCASLGIGVTTCAPNKYCCYGLGGCDCNNSTQTFTLAGGSIIQTLYSTAASLSATSTSQTTSPTTSATTSGSGSSTSSSAAASSTTAASSNNGSSTNVVAIGAGVGVGVGVLVLLVAAIVAALFYRRRKDKREKEAASVAGNGGQYAQYQQGASSYASPHYSAAHSPAQMYPQEMAAPVTKPPAELDTGATPSQMAEIKTANSMHGAPSRYG